MAQALAAKHGVFIHAGSIMEKIEGEGRIHNTSVVFDRKGKEIARYRKIHLFDVTTPDGASYKESETVKAGDAVVTYDCEGVTVGCSICYDLRFPDLFQALAAKGAQVIALPAAFTHADRQGSLGDAAARPRDRDGDLSLRRGADRVSFTVDNERRETYGHSLVADPWGHVVAKASDGIGIVSTRIEMAVVERVRRLIPVAQHRVALPRA